MNYTAGLIKKAIGGPQATKGGVLTLSDKNAIADGGLAQEKGLVNISPGEGSGH